MTEIEIVAECDRCETQFDDGSDVDQCPFCRDSFCENCQEEHAQEIIFTGTNENTEIKKFLEQNKIEILKEERARVKKLKK